MDKKMQLSLKTKYHKNIILGIVSVVGLFYGLSTPALFDWKWILLMFIAAFMSYKSISTLFFSKSIIFLKNDTYLFIIILKTHEIDKKREEILKGDFYTNRYELVSIKKIWRKKLFLVDEEIIVNYQNKESKLFDLNGDFYLLNEDINSIIDFIQNSNDIQLV